MIFPEEVICIDRSVKYLRTAYGGIRIRGRIPVPLPHPVGGEAAGIL